MRGQSRRRPLCTTKLNLPLSAVSSAARQTSPSPCAACPSPVRNSPPLTCYGRAAASSRQPVSLLSMLPACTHGGELLTRAGVGRRDQPHAPEEWPQRDLDRFGERGHISFQVKGYHADAFIGKSSGSRPSPGSNRISE